MIELVHYKCLMCLEICHVPVKLMALLFLPPIREGIILSTLIENLAQSTGLYILIITDQGSSLRNFKYLAYTGFNTLPKVKYTLLVVLLSLKWILKVYVINDKVSWDVVKLVTFLYLLYNIYHIYILTLNKKQAFQSLLIVVNPEIKLQERAIITCILE